jgi:hypothetical protein
VNEVAVDLEDDRFDVRFDASRSKVRELLSCIRELGYTPMVVDKSSSDAAPGVTQAALSELPEDVQSVFSKAREGRLVLLDFFAPG